MSLISKLFGRKGVDFGDGFLRTSFVPSPYWSSTAGAKGPAWDNSAVMACMAYLVRTMPEARLRVKTIKGDEEETVPQHKVYDLLKSPNPTAGYMWSDIVSALAVSLSLDGNGYLRKRRNGYSQLAALEFVPFGSCTPCERQPGSGLTHYSVYNGRAWEDVDPTDIVHFRVGIDPEDTMRGMSPFKSIAREVLTDNEASVYNHSILRNMGVLGFLITPGKGLEFTAEQASALQDRIMRQYTGEDRGKPAALQYEANVQQIGNTPDKMQVREIRQTPEERISAVFGIPAIVAGLGAGLERSTFANMKEAREMAVESCNAPLWRRMAETLDASLQQDRLLRPGEFLEFDLSTVRALQEDENDKANRMALLYEKGVIKRSEGRSKLGWQSTPEDEVYATDLQAARAEDALMAQEARNSQERQKMYRSLMDGVVD